jgi:hypothetical protein
MCRLAARSDRLQAIALAEWAVAAGQTKRRERSGSHYPAETPFSAYRKAS